LRPRQCKEVSEKTVVEVLQEYRAFGEDRTEVLDAAMDAFYELFFHDQKDKNNLRVMKNDYLD
jgi:hypothetical protein